jgi:glucose uptake protein GlcU
MGSRPL